jgi:hypothetical protein
MGYPQLQFHLANILIEEQIPGRRFGGFWASAIFQHIPEAEWPSLFDNLNRMRSKGAVGCFTLPEDRQARYAHIEEDRRLFEIVSREQVRR